MLNDSGEAAQSRRNGCAISAVAVRNLGRNTQLFTQYQDAEGKAGDIEDADIFIEGFRMGALIVMDVLLKTA